MKTKLFEIINFYESKKYSIQTVGKVDINIFIDTPKSILAASKQNISFVGKKFADQFETLITQSNCTILFIDHTFSLKNLPENKIYIVSQNPKQDIIDYCKHFLDFQKPNNETKIHHTAVVHESVKIGSNTIINPFVVIEQNVIIGDNCTIDSNTVIKENCVIGNNVDIGCSNTIGGTGFGFAQNKETKLYEQFPHFGSVLIGNNVSIGNNTCIDKGSLSDTIISNGVKIDNLVHIAHNVEIQENSLVIAHAMVAGSVNIGENCWIAPSSCIRNGISIGSNSTIGLASTVTKSVKENETVMGSPALPIQDFSILRKDQKETLNRLKKDL